jgi:phage baseplate assembly protein W
MVYTISANPLTEIKINPENVVDEVVQNVNMILSTALMSCPLYRDFGINTTFIDSPEPAARSLLIAEIYDKIEKYEPRAEVESVTFEASDKPGKIIPVVEVTIKNE